MITAHSADSANEMYETPDMKKKSFGESGIDQKDRGKEDQRKEKTDMGGQSAEMA